MWCDVMWWLERYLVRTGTGHTLSVWQSMVMADSCTLSVWQGTTIIDIPLAYGRVWLLSSEIPLAYGRVWFIYRDTLSVWQGMLWACDMMCIEFGAGYRSPAWWMIFRVETDDCDSERYVNYIWLWHIWLSSSWHASCIIIVVTSIIGS